MEIFKKSFRQNFLKRYKLNQISEKLPWGTTPSYVRFSVSEIVKYFLQREKNTAKTLSQQVFSFKEIFILMIEKAFNNNSNKGKNVNNETHQNIPYISRKVFFFAQTLHNCI